MDVREGVVWHDGTPFTPEDVVWSIERAGDPKSGNPVAFIWAGIGNFKIDGHRITADVKQFDPTLFKWMAFLTGYVLPKAYYEKVGAEGFEKKPVGTGPYMVDEYRGQRVSCASRPTRNTGAASRPSRPSSSSSCRTRRAASPKSRAVPPT